MRFMHFVKFFKFHGFDGEDVVGHFMSYPKDLSIGAFIDFSLGNIAITIKDIVDKFDFLLHF